MHQVNIHDAKTQLSKLIEEAVKGEPFIIAKAGKPLVIVKRIDAPQHQKRLGCLAGIYQVPDDFDSMGSIEIEQLFGT
jgi:antitoxin (DNA-binding transcriptional repressor) of toxin-antitoxin stability system